MIEATSQTSVTGYAIIRVPFSLSVIMGEWVLLPKLVPRERQRWERTLRFFLMSHSIQRPMSSC